MCLVSVLPKGTSKYSEEVTSFIKSGARSNTHGSGFMYKRDGESVITVSKGYFSIIDLLEDIDKAKLKDSDELVIHHRISTAGAVTDENTHPFVISKIHEEVCSVNITTNKPCLVHNGMFRNLDKYERLNPNFSDTYAFARYIMSNTIDFYKENTEIFLDSLSSIIGWSRICVLFPDRDLIMTGDFKEDNGYYHSNDGYKNWSHKDVGGVSTNSKVGKTLVGKNSSKAGSNQLTLPVAVQSLKNKIPLVLDGNLIDITEFNYKHFIYQIKDVSNYYTYTLEEWPEDPENAVIECDKGNYIRMTPTTLQNLQNNYNFHPKNQYKAFYEEYIAALNILSPSKNVLKDIYRVLSSNRKEDLNTTFKIKKKIITRFTLINYYMSLVKNYMSPGSQFYNIKLAEFVDKDTETEIEDSSENLNDGVELEPVIMD